MLEINLLPENERKVVRSSIADLHRIPLTQGAAVLMATFVLVLLLPLQINRIRIGQLKAKVRTLEPKMSEINQLERATQRLRSQETAFRTLKTEYRLWSKKLNVISDLTPDGVWFTDFSLNDKGLVIQGSAIGQNGADEMGSVGRLVQDLKADPDISSAIQDLQIESIKRGQEKDTEIVYFTLKGSLVSAQNTDETKSF